MLATIDVQCLYQSFTGSCKMVVFNCIIFSFSNWNIINSSFHLSFEYLLVHFIQTEQGGLMKLNMLDRFQFVVICIIVEAHILYN